MGTEQDLNRRTVSTGYDGHHRDPDAIKHDIDRTRSRMDETIDALSAKLQPRNLVHEALGWAGYETQRSPGPQETMNSFLKAVGYDLLHSFRDSAKDAARNASLKAGKGAWQVARCHPLPSALIGAGIAWLAYEGSCSLSSKARMKGWSVHNPEPRYGGSYVDARTGQPYESSYGSEFHGGSTEASQPAASSFASGAGRPMPARTPDPAYGGSYVDARTGQPYDRSYGQQAQGTRHEERANVAGASCPPGYSPSSSVASESSGTASSGDTGEAGHGIAGYAREAASRAAGTVRSGASRVTGAAHSGAATVTGAAHSGATTITGAATSGVSALSEAARSGTHYATDTARSATHTLAHGVSTMKETMTHSASNAAHYLSDSTRHALHQVSSGLDYSRHRASHAVHEYPLAIGAVALGVGLLLGLALPRTRREEELLGERARQLRERARQASQEAIERGRRAARETVHAVTEEVERQGLTPSGLKDTVRGFASRMAEDVREEAREAGLTMDSVKDKARQVAERAQETAAREVAGGESGEDSGESQAREQA